MKTKFRILRPILLPLGLASGLFLASCDSDEDNARTDPKDPSLEKTKKEIGQAADATGQYVSAQFEKLKESTYVKKEEFQREGRKALEKLDDSIDRLEQSLGDMQEDAKARARETIADLKVKRAAAAERLDEVGDSSEEAWDELRGGFVEAYQALKDAASDAHDEFEDKN